MRSLRERESGSTEKELRNISKVYARILHSPELANQLGLGEEGVVSNLVSVRYDEEHDRVLFVLNLKQLNVLQLDTLRTFVRSKVPAIALRLNTDFETEGSWYLEKK
jgi:hypothetical protein